MHKSAIWLKVKVTLFKLLDTFLSNLVTFILALGSVKNLNMKLSFDPSVHLALKLSCHTFLCELK